MARVGGVCGYHDRLRSGRLRQQQEQQLIYFEQRCLEQQCVEQHHHQQRPCDPGGEPAHGADRGRGDKRGYRGRRQGGGQSKLPSETIGIVNVLQASEAAQRLQAGAEQAAKALGWKVSAVDAAGDPTKSEADMVAFVNEGVGAIVDLSNPTAAITQGLAEARAKNIPVINIGGVQNPSPNIEAQYYGDPSDLTAALDKYMFAKLPPHAQIAEFTSKIEYDEQKRDAQFEADAKAAGATVYTYPINLANLSGDATTSAHTALLAHPVSTRSGVTSTASSRSWLRCSRAPGSARL